MTDQPEHRTDSWISLDELVARTPVAFAQTRLARELDGDGEACCCCCCCCCKDEGEPEPPPPVMTEPLTVAARAVWERLIDPRALAAGTVVTALRGEFRWRARGQQGVRVEIEVRSEGPDGRAAGQFPAWTPIIRDQPAVDVGRFVVEARMGHRLRFRGKASDAAGNVAYSDIITISPGPRP